MKLLTSLNILKYVKRVINKKCFTYTNSYEKTAHISLKMRYFTKRMNPYSAQIGKYLETLYLILFNINNICFR
jgi:hypothetical protein